MTARQTILLGLLGLLLVSCAAPPPKASDYQRSVPPDYLGLMVDSDLLGTSRLDQEDKTAAQELLKVYYTTEYSLRTYIDALEAHLAENEQLTKDYSTADAYVGAVSGLSSIGVIFATAVVALPVTGVVWIAVSQYIQHYKIDPEIARTDRQLTEAQHLLRLFPDIEKIFDGLAFSETYDEAHRRFTKWATYVKTLEARTAKFFSKTGDGQPAPGSATPGTPPVTPSQAAPSQN